MNGDMNRRSFLALGAGGLVAAAMADAAGVRPKSPALSLSGPLAAPTSPLLKTVTFTQLELPVGASRSFKAIHCSDSHLNFMNITDLLAAETVDDLRMYESLRVKHNALAPFAACVLKARLENVPLLHTGDVWSFHSTVNRAMARDAFSRVGEVFYAIGNHELSGHWNPAPGFDPQKIRAEVAADLPNDTRFAAWTKNGVKFVSFDDTPDGKPFLSEQAAFLRRELADGLPTVLLCHFPFCTEETVADLVAQKGPFAAMAERRRKMGKKPLVKKNIPGLLFGQRGPEKELVDWLLAQPNLKAILCGHLHAEARYRLNDHVTEFIAGATMNGHASEIEFV